MFKNLDIRKLFKNWKLKIHSERQWRMRLGYPIRKSPDQRLLVTSPKLIADCYALHR